MKVFVLSVKGFGLVGLEGRNNYLVRIDFLKYFFVDFGFFLIYGYSYKIEYVMFDKIVDYVVLDRR